MIIYHAKGFLSMKTCIYFAGNGDEPGPRLHPGWGFSETGLPRFGGGPGDGVLLDDRWPPRREAIGPMAEALQNAALVVCDFEKPPSSLLAELVRRLAGKELIVPEICADLPHSAVLVGPYAPPGSFSRWLERKRRRYGRLVLDAEPIRCTLRFGAGSPAGVGGGPEPGGLQTPGWRPCPGALCLCRRTADGFDFRDTHESLPARCAAAGVPAIVFDAAWNALAER